jgi:PPK2 family polyphosphate:nucleotide phosphotransferase
MTLLSRIRTLPPEDTIKKEVREEFTQLQKRLFDLQAVMYAQQKYCCLIVLQGMDAAGKDNAVKNVFTGVNPMGCRVKSFKVPTEEEKNHDFLWRIHKQVPEKGIIQIFNRSHYEDILVPSVHNLMDASIIEERYELINQFERLLLQNNTHIFKFYLHVSAEEQKERLNERLTDRRKHWKYQEADLIETRHRKTYLKVYEQIFKRCSHPVPWHIIPSDKKWYKNYLITKTVVEDLEKLDMQYPAGTKK